MCWRDVFAPQSDPTRPESTFAIAISQVSRTERFVPFRYFLSTGKDEVEEIEPIASAAWAVMNTRSCVHTTIRERALAHCPINHRVFSFISQYIFGYGKRRLFQAVSQFMFEGSGGVLEPCMSVNHQPGALQQEQ